MITLNHAPSTLVMKRVKITNNLFNQDSFDVSEQSGTKNAVSFSTSSHTVSSLVTPSIRSDL